MFWSQKKIIKSSLPIKLCSARFLLGQRLLIRLLNFIPVVINFLQQFLLVAGSVIEEVNKFWFNDWVDYNIWGLEATSNRSQHGSPRFQTNTLSDWSIQNINNGQERKMKGEDGTSPYGCRGKMQVPSCCCGRPSTIACEGDKPHALYLSFFFPNISTEHWRWIKRQSSKIKEIRYQVFLLTKERKRCWINYKRLAF